MHLNVQLQRRPLLLRPAHGAVMGAVYDGVQAPQERRILVLLKPERNCEAETAQP